MPLCLMLALRALRSLPDGAADGTSTNPQAGVYIWLGYMLEIQSWTKGTGRLLNLPFR
jgi:hypothetical protein